MIMKTKILYILFILLTFQGFSQSLTPEFEFQLYFEDAAGKKDTLILGYDENATDSIDTSFGEINLINQPWTSDSFEVFVTDRGITPTIKSKKQIVNPPCTNSWQNWVYRTLFISIKNAQFPIQLSLNTSLLQNNCLNGSFLAVDDDPHWWAYLYLNQSAVLEEPDYLNQYQDTTDGKTISYYWLILADSSQQSYILSNDNFEKNPNIKVSPNPFNEKITISGEYPVSNIQFSNLQGESIKFERNGNTIVPFNTSKGLYLLTFELQGNVYTYKILKQ